MNDTDESRRVMPVWVQQTERGFEVAADILCAVLTGDSQPLRDHVERVQVVVVARIESRNIEPGAAGWAEVEAAARRELVAAAAALPIVGQA